MLVQVIPSDKKGKRFRAIFSNGVTTDFGSASGSTYIDHKDKTKRLNYLERHKVNENWSNPYKAGSLSAFLLWGKHTNLLDNIKAFNNFYF